MGIGRANGFTNGNILEYNANVLEFANHTIGKRILTPDGQGGESGIIIVPTPAFAPINGFLHGTVGIDVSTKRVNTHFVESRHHILDIVVGNQWVETTHTVKITRELALLNLTRIAKTGGELMVEAGRIS